jgi:hypothetical protein
MTYACLEEIITLSCGKKMKIVDLGASADLKRFSKKGTSCVF